jgi:hypothetical protein
LSTRQTDYILLGFFFNFENSIFARMLAKAIQANASFPAVSTNIFWVTLFSGQS